MRQKMQSSDMVAIGFLVLKLITSPPAPLIQSHHVGLCHKPLLLHVIRQIPSRRLIIQIPDANAIKKTLGVVISLDHHRTKMWLNQSLQPLSVVRIAECSYLHGIDAGDSLRAVDMRWLEKVEPDRGRSRPNDPKRFGGSVGKINHSTRNKWPAIIDAHIH